MKNKYLRFCYIFILLISLALTGCSNEGKKEASSSVTQKLEPTKAPVITVAPTVGAATEDDSSTASIIIPDINLEKQTLPDNDALKFVAAMKIGWNLGNTFDAVIDNPDFEDELQYESAWCGVKTSKEMIDELKAAGFNTVRIPVSWHNHVSGSDFKISDAWMQRVKEVVDYAMNDDMYVIINIHHDISPDYYYPSSDYLKSSTTYVKSIWKQIAVEFGDYDNHLIFESINEPRLVGTENEWWLDLNKDTCKDAVECINQLNQTFVDTVRATKGSNETRYLMVPGYTASPDNALIDTFKLPTDLKSNDNKIIVSVHAYTPYNFALQGINEGGNVSEWNVDNVNSTKDIDSFMGRLYNKFTSKGIPVVIGEFGARDKNGNLQSRVEYATYYIKSAKTRGITCCWWDNNAFSGNGENFGLLDRKTLIWVYPDILNGLMKYSE